MNRLLITEVGDSIRKELLQELDQSRKQKTLPKLQRQPEIHQSTIQTSFLFSDTDRYNDNPLYQKTLSEIALNNLTRAASMSLLGKKCQSQLECQIRDHLNLPKNLKYLNQNLAKYVNHIVCDKQLQTKKKRQLLKELHRLESKNPQDELSQFSSHVEEVDLSRKLMEIVNAEGKLEQLKRRYERKQMIDKKMKLNLALSVEKQKERFDAQIDSINPLSTSQLAQRSKQYYIHSDLDKSQQRYHQRLREKHNKNLKPIWNSHHFPTIPNRWKSWIDDAQLQKQQ